jgi:hypothetical protein
VWCVTALPARRRSGDALRGCLEWAADAGVASDALDVRPEEPLLQLAQRLEAMLGGSRQGDAELGAAERELYAEGARDSEAWIRERVRPGDIVVLYDALAAVLAEAIRARGAHAVAHVRITAAPQRGPAGEVATFMARSALQPDAYVASWQRPEGHGGVLVEQIAAAMPSADVVSRKDITVDWGEPEAGPYWAEPARDLGWSSALADVVHRDHDERVGGTHHPRPAVAAR